MHGAQDLLTSLALTLGIAAVTTVLFQQLRQPVVLGYLLAGLLIGPHVPLPFPVVVDAAPAHTLSELGVILVMFSLGLEFSVRRLLRVGPGAAAVAVIECSLMLWLGLTVGRLFGWTANERLFTGAMVAISSTTIIARAFAERERRGRLHELVFGVLIVEDLIAILLLAALTAVGTGSGVSPSALAGTLARLGLFLAAMVVGGLLVVPRFMRRVVGLRRPETTLVVAVGLCFSFALLARAFGYSVALGAFVAGSLVAESGVARQVEHLVHPVRDMFAAIFFVSVGMLIEPALLLEHWRAVLALTLVVVVGKVVGVGVAAFLGGNGVRTSVQAGMSLAQIGEFSFIIAGVGLALGVVRPFLYPTVVAVSALTTLLTPYLIRASVPVASLVDRKLPRALQTFAALYGSWVEQLRQRPRNRSGTSQVHRLARLLLIDAAFLVALLIGTSLAMDPLVARLERGVGLSFLVARLTVLSAAGVLSFPFLLGSLRCVQRLGALLAAQALPVGRPGRTDLAAAPRRMLTVTLQLAILLAVGVPLMAITQPFLPSFQGAAVLLLALVGMGVAFWRSTANLHGHVRAGAEMIAEVLARQSHGEDEPAALTQVHGVLPGLGEPAAVRLLPGSPAVGRTLAQLNLRGLTGATVLVIRRGEQEIAVPAGDELLQVDDLLAVAGTHDAVEAALRRLAPA